MSFAFLGDDTGGIEVQDGFYGVGEDFYSVERVNASKVLLVDSLRGARNECDEDAVTKLVGARGDQSKFQLTRDRLTKPVSWYLQNGVRGSRNPRGQRDL